MTFTKSPICLKCGCILAYKIKADQVVPEALRKIPLLGCWLEKRFACPEDKWPSAWRKTEPDEMARIIEHRTQVCKACEHYSEAVPTEEQLNPVAESPQPEARPCGGCGKKKK